MRDMIWKHVNSFLKIEWRIMGNPPAKKKEKKERKHSTWNHFIPGQFFFLVFLGPRLWHMEVPRLGVKSELHLLAWGTATSTPDPSCICNLHHSSWHHRILNPLVKTRDWTHNLMIPSRICFFCAMTWTPPLTFNKWHIVGGIQCTYQNALGKIYHNLNSKCF